MDRAGKDLLTLHQRQRRAEVVGATREVVGAVHRINHPGAATGGFLGSALLTEQAILRAQGSERLNNELLGSRIRLCYHVRHGRLLGGLQSLGTHAQGKAACGAGEGGGERGVVDKRMLFDESGGQCAHGCHYGGVH